MEKVLSVSELTNYIKRTLEEGFPQIKLIGEISNFKAHVSGHWYFTLKDKDASINCTMWKGINNYVFFTPQDGMKVLVTGKITVYPPRGSYQLDVRSMKPAGEGELQKAFEELKRRLSDEGLFDVENKQEIPRFPQKIGIVTGSDTAALRDMLNIAERRYPIAEIILAPAKVQGDGAAEEISEMIYLLNKRKDIDVIIIARGGGSLEDLWAFNEEIVARSVFESSIPVISGVGHEIDFTIADFAADLRAPTPSAAMELATPDKDELFAFIDDFSYTSAINISEKIKTLRENISLQIKSFGFRNLENIINVKKQTVDNYLYKVQRQIVNFISRKKALLELSNRIITANNIDKILKKGFAIVEQDNEIVKRKSEFNAKLEFDLRFSDGRLRIKK